jgi:hypothetical protein
MDMEQSKLYCEELMKKEKLSLSDIAEIWTFQNGSPIPKRGTDEWGEMFKTWTDTSFKDEKAAE